MISPTPTIERCLEHDLEKLADAVPAFFADGLSIKRFGDLPKWLDALQALPDICPSTLDLKDSVTIGDRGDCSHLEFEQLKTSFEALIPWRKGPYQVFGLDIDTEWRSDWKWNRLRQHIKPLDNKLVLDVGCGNGYHCLRMLGENAKMVVGIDPSPRFLIQFHMLKRYLGDAPVEFLPATLEQLPKNLEAFDTCFSMGVLYHRRSPIDHIRDLKATLKPGGQLVLETLVIEGEEGKILVPEGRYAMMNNVWFLPSPATLEGWLRKCGFSEVRTVDISVTTTKEQRATDWMKFQSLPDFLDPDDPLLTAEGHPAPTRAILVATK